MKLGLGSRSFLLLFLSETLTTCDVMPGMPARPDKLTPLRRAASGRPAPCRSCCHSSSTDMIVAACAIHAQLSGV
jgi:hypothetical protein